jgi:hypothetical protein
VLLALADLLLPLASLTKTLLLPVFVAAGILALLVLGAIAGAIAIGILAVFATVGRVVFGRDLRPRWLRRGRGASA